ncbi:MAG: ExeA family protein [Planctomycetota bacterium]
MYEAYWKLTARPFAQAADPPLYFRSQSCAAALVRFRYAVDNLSGPALLLGSSGSGKTSLIRWFASEHTQLRPFVHVVIPSLGVEEQLRMLLSELSDDGRPGGLTGSLDAVFRELRVQLRRHAACGRRPLLFFDDAHLLSDDCLQQVVLPLLHLAESDANLKLSLLLAAQPAFAVRVRRFSQLSERVAVTSSLSGFSHEETATYVRQCLELAGTTATIFTRGAVQRLQEASGGIPRRLNRLCDMALLVGFAEQKSQLSEADIDAITGELMPAAA